MSQPPTELTDLHRPPDRFRHHVLVLPIIALALFVRLSTLDAASLWCDEIGQVTSYYFDS